jgi:hypothetical protein
MTDRPQEARTKGLNFRAFTGSLARLRGKDAVEATLDAAPADVRDAVRFGQIIASGWYPVAWYRELYLAAQRALDVGVELPRELGRDATTHDFNSVFKIVLKMLTPETAFGQVHRLITLYYEGGIAQKIEVKHGVGRVRFTGWDGFDRNVWEDLGSSAEAIVSLCGAKNVRKYVLAGGKDGCSDLDLELRWG